MIDQAAHVSANFDLWQEAQRLAVYLVSSGALVAAWKVYRARRRREVFQSIDLKKKEIDDRSEFEDRLMKQVKELGDEVKDVRAGERSLRREFDELERKYQRVVLIIQREREYIRSMQTKLGELGAPVPPINFEPLPGIEEAQ